MRAAWTAIRQGGSAEHAQGEQWFFKEEIQSRGWYTADLRRFVRAQGLEIARAGGLALLLDVADELFSGEVLEEKNVAVFLLEKPVTQFGENEFRRFEG